ncbi:nucleotidyltransferase domain-containing protein [Sulfurimonas sp. SAG-AH-194-I05]|nr:nucleotidyltransferase domain-containing protein [Sulfurimonas sp. SAG-AH-194-I05]MDF1875743.1 nucleotidyltransferase domain-containing protein [Sulfurimonas sp. SAG-AH-194-I05]
MRLSVNEITIIKDVILNSISDAKIILFGSRIYDDKKGGDIDICIKTKQNISLAKKIKILTKIELAGIFRKVDVIVQTPQSKYLSIFDTIKKEGILL